MELPNLTKNVILGGLLYFRSCREQYLALMKGNRGTLLDSNSGTAYSNIERTIRLFISTDLDVSPSLLMSRFVEDMQRLPRSNPQLINSYCDVVEALDKQDQYTEQLCTNMLKQCGTTIVVQDAVAELKKLNAVPKIQESLRDVASRLAGIEKPGKLKLYDPVQSAQELLVHRDKVPTGVTFLDQLLGGGIVWGEHGGCLGPSGGGKSTIANMLLCNMAIQGYNCMLLQFEQSVKYNSDIMSRIYSYLTGMPRAEFADKSYSELSDAAKEALKRCSKVSSRIRVGSFTDDSLARSVATITESIDDAIETGFTPRLVIIDWLGAVVSEFLAEASGQDEGYPIAAQRIQDQLGAYGKEHNISFFFLHQSSNDAANKPPAYKPNRFDSYYFRGFAQKLEYCLEIGSKSKQPDGKFACWINCDKVRGAEPDKSVVVLLDGANAKMEVTKEGEYMTNSKGQFVSQAGLLAGSGNPQLDTEPEELDTYMAGF